MMPQNVLSDVLEFGTLIPPRNQRLVTDHLVDYEQGGIAVGDASQGLQVQTWTCNCDGHNFVVTSPSDPGGTNILNVAGNVVDMSFTFDQLMRPFVAYMLDDNTSHFHWFDSSIPGFTTTDLPANSLYPRCTLDDKRAPEALFSDILLAYTRAGRLYFRQQRDRYGVEYQLTNGNFTTSRLNNIGINSVLRMQFNLTPPGQ